VLTLDINPKFQPTICCDLLDWDFEKFKPGHFDVIVASPPCQLFSNANQHKPDGLHIGDCLILQTLRIIEYLRPKVWLLENPRTGELARRAYMQHIPHADFDYCEFSEWGYKKTDTYLGKRTIVACQVSCMRWEVQKYG